MKEIELKAWNMNPSKVQATVQTFAKLKNTAHKMDVYWQLNFAEKEKKPLQVRIRKTESEIIVTYKEKEFSDGIEVNTEYEFTISDAVPLERILLASGYTIQHKKEKRTVAYTPVSFVPTNSTKAFPTTIELSEVIGLGNFVEIEILLPDESDDTTITEARQKLRKLLMQCGIPESSIEPRYYNQMLQEKQLDK